jgi:hypothetical protein
MQSNWIESSEIRKFMYYMISHEALWEFTSREENQGETLASIQFSDNPTMTPKEKLKW